MYKKIGELRLDNPHDWIWALFLLGGIGLAFLFSNYRPQIFQFFQAIFSKRVRNEIERDESEVARKVSLYLNLFFFYSISVFIFQLLIYYNFKFNNSFLLFSAISISILLYYLFRLILIRFIGNAFKTEFEPKQYLFYCYLGYKILGIIAFPISLILTYAREYQTIMLYIMFGIIGISLLQRCFSGLSIGFNQTSLPKLYSFLYICTLEILPVLIAGKLLGIIN